MKKHVLLMITFVLCGVFAAWAQNNDKISYQAVVRDSENRLVYNTELQVTVSLANSATGAAVYSERHTVTSNANGLISLLIGDGQDRQGNWGDVRWNTAWVTATVRSADGQTQIAEHHLPLSAVPYALYANYADSMDLAVLQNYLDEHQYVTEDELPSAQANADWTESNPDTASFIKHKPDLGVYATNEHLDDTLGHYVLNTDFTDYTNVVGQNFTKMTNRMDTLLTHVCDSVSDCVHGWISDSTRMVIDSLGAYYDTTQVKTAIHDTAETIRSLIPTVPTVVSAFTNDVPYLIEHQSLEGYVTKQALNDTLDDYVMKADLCGEVKNCIKDTLSHYTTTNQLDTVIRKYGYVTNAHLNDTLAAVYNTIRTDSTALHKAIKDTASAIRGDICDSATACIKKALADASSEINHAIDTIARNNIHDTAQAIRAAIHDSLSSYKIKDCGDVTTCVNAALIDGASATNHAIDSIAGNVIHDSIKTNIQININNTIHDSIENNISKQIHDSIGNITIPTAVTDLSDAGNYLKTSDLCSTIESNCTNVTLKNAVNNFSGKNHFTDSVTVPSNTSIPRPATAEHSCTDNVASAVNICDLLAVFDSLTNRIKKLEDEVNALKSAVPPVFNSLTLSDSTATTMKVTAAFTSTGIPISEYQYCYSKNSDMSASSCTTSTSNSVILTGLDPYTRYYVTVSAVNVAGTTTSVIKNARTLAYAPTATTVNVAEHKPTGFQVNVSGLDFKEPAVSGTVQICYKQKGSEECAVDPTNTYSDYVTCETPQNATNSSDITKIINNIELSQNYCVIVKVSNADSTTIYGPFSVTPANVTLTVTGTPSVTYHCGSPDEAPHYTATLSGDDPDNYTFSWTGGTAEITNQTEYNPTLSETTIVTCTATHKTLNYDLSDSDTTEVTIASVLPVISLCTEELTVTDKGSTNIDSVKWSDDETSFTLTNSVGHTYTTDGVYTITAKNTANCVATRQVVVGKVTVQPCTAPSTHVAQNLISGNDGKETVDANGKVVKVMDYDGHSYSVVQIGNQCWMAENLRTTHYGDGTAITQGSVASSAARYYIPKDGNNQNLNDSVFGLLYNWYAATRINNANDGLSEGKQGVCPQGWHVPTQSDWTTMETFVNGGTPLDHTIGNLSGNIAGKLAKGCAWTSSETEKASGNFAYSDRNAIGLGIVPAGRFNKNDTYTNYGSMAEFWVSYGGVNAYPYSWDITNDSPGTRLDYSNETNYKQYALSVRCVRDTVYSCYELSIDEDNSGASQNLNSTANVSYTATLKVDGVNVSTGVTYSWSLSTSDGATLSSTTGSTVTVTYTKNGTYSVSCTATFNSKDITNSKTTTVSQLTTTTFCSKAFLDHSSFPPAQTNKVGNDGKETVDENGNLLTVSDRDGNIYHVVEIGYPNDVWKHECWITTNLRVKTKPNGDPVDYKYPHDGENVINDSVYGLLYQWNTAMNGTSATTQWKSHVRGICPDGWHIPVPWDWLMRGGTNQYSPTYTDTAAVKFAKGNDWVSSSASDSPGDYSSVYRNKLGFSAVPAGYYDNATTSYIGYGSEARFWTTNQQNDTKAWYKALIYDQDKMQSLSTSKENYVSIRCIRNRISN